MRSYFFIGRIKLLVVASVLFMSACADKTTDKSQGLSGGILTYEAFLGLNLEGVRKAPPGPYDHEPENTKQRYVAAGEEKVTVMNSAGDKIVEKTGSPNTYGALYLQHPDDGDYLYIYGLNGKSLCPLEEGAFCQIDIPGSNNTTDAKYACSAGCDKRSDSLMAVKEGRIQHITPSAGAGFEDTEIFDGTNLAGASGDLFTFDPISTSAGIGVTSDGFVYHIDTGTDVATDISPLGGAGSGIRDVVCEQFESGQFGCAIQSFGDSQITPCFGSNAGDFSCGTPVSAGDGVSLGVLETKDGNLGVVSTAFSGGTVHLNEFTPAFSLVFQGEFQPNNLDLPNLGLQSTVGLIYNSLGHAEVDADTGSFLVTDFDSGALAHILFSDINEDFSLLGEGVSFFWF